MTGTDRSQPVPDDATDTDRIGTRRATITSEVDAPETVAAAIAPDDTDEIDTRVEDGLVVTTIERETTGGLQATIDDSVVALDVATETVSHAVGIDDSRTDSTAEEQHTDRHDTNSP